jgi:hypothetical protein
MFYAKKMKKVVLCFFVFTFFSCVNTPENIQKKLEKKYCTIQHINTIEGNWGNHYKTYFALDITMVNNNKLWLLIKRTGGFSIARVGNYIFGASAHLKYDNEEQLIELFHIIPGNIEYFSEGIGVKIKTIENVIDNYDKIYKFIHCCPV